MANFGRMQTARIAWIFQKRLLCSSFSLSPNSYNVERKVTMENPIEKKPLWFYNNKAIRRRKLDQLLNRSKDSSPREDSSLPLTEVSEDVVRVKHICEILSSYEIHQKDIKAILFAKPHVMEISRAILQKRLVGFLALQLPRDAIKRMVVKCPSVLLVDQEAVSLQKRLNFMQELPVFPRLTQEKCLYLVQKCPQLFLIKEKANFSQKLRNLSMFGLNEQQLYELVLKHPAMLTYSENSVKQKAEYVTKVMGARSTLLVKFPRVFSSSLQRIRERYEYLINEGFISSKSYISENKLRAIVLTTDKDFVYRITDTKMKNFRVFQTKTKEKHDLSNYDSIIDDVILVQNEAVDDIDGYEGDENEDDGNDSDDDFDTNNNINLRSLQELSVHEKY